jgi:hypothetical protein
LLSARKYGVSRTSGDGSSKDMTELAELLREGALSSFLSWLVETSEGATALFAAFTGAHKSSLIFSVECLLQGLLGCGRDKRIVDVTQNE